MFACLHGQGDLTALAFEFSPLVERTAADTVTFDVAGLERLFGPAQDVAQAIARRAAETGVKANLALAMNPDAAICAARGFAGVSVVPQGDEAKFLGPCRVGLLACPPGEGEGKGKKDSPPCPSEIFETLDRWGIRTLRELAALPPLGIAERLGPEGLRLRELARGEAERKLVPLEDPLRFEDEIELDYPLEILEPLAFLLARLLNGLTTRLATRGLATDELRLRLKLENRAAHQRVLRLPVPSRDAPAFLKLLELDLNGHPPPAPVVHVRLEMNPVKPQAAQAGLYVPAAPEPVKLELTLARIGALVGRERVGHVELLDTHRPDAFRPAAPVRAATIGERSCAAPADGQPQAFRRYRPARAAQVALASGQPDFVAAQGIRGRVVEYAGPWRSSGDWWTAGAWQRDEWDIALSDGALYRLYCEPRGWFVEGSYD